MKLALVRSTVLLALVLAASTSQARPPEGAYIGFGLGYAAASGDRGVETKFDPTVIIVADPDELIRTDFGSGMSFDLHFGWLIGPVAPEIGVVGHGNFEFEDGAGYPNFVLRFHPMLLADSLAELKFDANVYLGAGYAIGGYQPKNDDDGKGWEGWALHFGLGLTYDITERVRVAFDFRAVMPQYSTFMVDWDDDINLEPKETPSTLVLIPSLQIVATF